MQETPAPEPIAPARPNARWHVPALAALLLALAAAVWLGLDGVPLRALAGAALLGGMVIAALAVLPAAQAPGMAAPTPGPRQPPRIPVDPMMLDLEIGGPTVPLIYDAPELPRVLAPPIGAVAAEDAPERVSDDAGDAPWDGRDRRGPNRARNVRRLPARHPPAAPGGEDEWEAF